MDAAKRKVKGKDLETEAKDHHMAPMPAPELNDPQLYINRELSWLEFNQRVLDQALDETNPLLERVKFLCIVSSKSRRVF